MPNLPFNFYGSKDLFRIELLENAKYKFFDKKYLVVFIPQTQTERSSVLVYELTHFELIYQQSENIYLKSGKAENFTFLQEFKDREEKLLAQGGTGDRNLEAYFENLTVESLDGLDIISSNLNSPLESLSGSNSEKRPNESKSIHEFLKEISEKNPEIEKAMNKSYFLSQGKNLSTNWDDVKDQKE